MCMHRFERESYIPRMPRVFRALVTVSLLGCDPSAQDTPDARRDDPKTTMVLECNDTFTLVAEFGETSAWGFFPDSTVRLTHVPSDSGAQYRSGPYLIWTEGEEAVVESPTVRFTGCRNNRRLAIWEDAKLRGVDFRATGNEPGWFMEIAHDSILVVADYGELTLSFPTPTPIEDAAKRQTTFETASGEHSLLVLLELEERRCQDSMADEDYETTVTIRLDGRELRGCGRALH